MKKNNLIMKNSKQLFIILVIFFSCSSKNHSPNPVLIKELKALSEPTQIFLLKADSTNVLLGKHGTKIEIKPNSFVKKDGSKPSNNIKFELKEFYTKSQMILNSLSTITNERLLETGGMIYINAVSNKDTLVLKNQIRVYFPNRFDLKEANYFKSDNDGASWYLNNYDIDTTIVTERIVTLSYGADSLITTHLRIIGNDTIPNFYSESESSSSNATRYFIFSVNELGWINCDRFYDISNPTKLKVINESGDDIMGYVIFDNLNSLIPIPFKNGEAKLEPLPMNEKVTLLLYTLVENSYQWQKHNIILGETFEIKIELEEISKDDLMNEIRNLQL